MPKLNAGIAIAISGVLLAACTADPSPHAFTAPDVNQKPDASALQTASDACKTQAQNNSIGNIVAIWRSIHSNADADKDYVKCMKDKGFNVEQ